MNAVFAPTAAIQVLTFSAMNSGPLSERIGVHQIEVAPETLDALVDCGQVSPAELDDPPKLARTLGKLFEAYFFKKR